MTSERSTVYTLLWPQNTWVCPRLYLEVWQVPDFVLHTLVNPNGAATYASKSLPEIFPHVKTPNNNAPDFVQKTPGYTPFSIDLSCPNVQNNGLFTLGTRENRYQVDMNSSTTSNSFRFVRKVRTHPTTPAFRLSAENIGCCYCMYSSTIKEKTPHGIFNFYCT